MSKAAIKECTIRIVWMREDSASRFHRQGAKKALRVFAFIFAWLHPRNPIIRVIRDSEIQTPARQWSESRITLINGGTRI